MAAKPTPSQGTKRAQPAGAAEQTAKKRKVYDEKPLRANRREERREVMAQAKTKWEQLRPKATSKAKSVALVSDLLQLLTGRIVEFVFRHDGSRIVQWMLADGDEKQKATVLEELMDGSKKPVMPGELPFFVQLACDRYGHHLAFKVLRVSDKKHRARIFEQYLKGNAALLMRNPHGADVLDFAYQTVLRSRAKSELVLELLYSKEKKLLDTVRSKLFGVEQAAPANAKKQTTAPKSIFAQSLELIGDTFKDVAVESSGTVLDQLLDKENFLRFEIVHAAVKEYLETVMNSYPKEKAQELAVSLAPLLVHFAHTKPGMFVAVNCVKILDAKHRKKVLRALKTHIRKLLEDEYGHRLILALFEWVDDTRLVGKTVSVELFSESSMAAEMAEVQETQSKSSSRGGKKKAVKKGLGTKEKSKRSSNGSVDMDYLLTVCQHKYARIPLLSLFFARDTRYFNPDMYRLVWSSIDTEKFGQLSKKDADTRRSELRVVFDAPVCDLMRQAMPKLLQNHWSAPVVLGALLGVETRNAAIDGIKSALSNNDTVAELIANTCARKTLATLFKVGGKDFAVGVLDNCGVNVVKKFTESEAAMPIARNLVAACGRADAVNILEKAERLLGSAG